MKRRVGRPTKLASSSTRVRQIFFITNEQRRGLETLAVRESVDMSDVVRTLLVKKLREEGLL